MFELATISERIVTRLLQPKPAAESPLRCYDMDIPCALCMPGTNSNHIVQYLLFVLKLSPLWTLQFIVVKEEEEAKASIRQELFLGRWGKL